MHIKKLLIQNLLEKDQYERRFKSGKYFSFFNIGKENMFKKIVGHTGFKISNLNPKFKGKINFLI